MKYLIFLFLFFNLTSFSQGEFNNWYFGAYAGVTFNQVPPIAIVGSPIVITGGTISSSVSDSIGNFLFCSNGKNVWNKDLVLMPNGSGLLGGDFYQTSLAVQLPGSTRYYYLFTVGTATLIGPQKGLYYSVIDMNLNGGKGDIIPGMKNIPLLEADSAFFQLAGTRHHNNRDVWIVILNHSLHSNKYMSFLLTSSGLSIVPVISLSGIKTNIPWRPHGGSLKISSDGLALACSSDTTNEICFFNPLTGQVNPRFQFKLFNQNIIYRPNFQEFSPHGRFIYFSAEPLGLHGSLFQYDVNAGDSLSFIMSQQFLSNSIDKPIQMASNGKIYFEDSTGYFLNVINSPDLPGTSCNIINHEVNLLNYGNNCLVQFIQKYKVYFQINGNCQNSVSFSSDIWPPADTIRWNFGDPASGTNNISALPNPAHIFTSPGTYTVELYVRHNDNRTDTTWKTITIFPSPVVSLGSDRSICAGDSVTFDAGVCSGCTFEWKDLTTSAVVGSFQTYTATTQGNYEVTVTNTGGCAGKDTVQVSFSPPPQITNSPLSKSICSGESTNIILSSTVPNTVFHWTASIASGSVSGFSADSGTVINQILSGSGVVNYHIIPKIGNCIGNAVDFPVTVTPGDSVKVSIIPSDNNLCTGASVTFTATPTGTGTLTYDWKVNGASQGVNSSTFNYAPANGDVITCVLSSSVTTCVSNNPATSNSVTMVVNPLQPVTVGVTSSANNICQGASVIFTASTTPSGGTKHYQWKVNNITSGLDQPSFVYVPANGDNVMCDLTVSGLSCITAGLVTSQPVNMVVNPNVNLSVSVTASANPVCSGIPVTFTASPPPGGTATYQWKVNNINSGLNQNTFSYVPVNNDVVECGLSITGMSCLQNNPATSNTITMGITAAPLVTFPACFDTITTATAKPIHLKGAIPYGGIYSGPGVNSATGIFTPSLAGTGTKAISYTYTNAGLCSSFKVKNIIVQPPAAFSCGNSFTDIRDNHTYKTIQIGTQCWMAEDLNFGTAIPQTTHQRDNCIAEKYAISVPPPFGGGQEGAYQWDELMDYSSTPGEKGLCPPGWHVPMEAEWQTLFSNWTNSAFAASPLKYSGYSGFTALLTGTIPKNTFLHFSGFATFYWTSTSHGTYKAWAHGFNDPGPSVSTYPASKENAFSTRCIKD